MIRNKISYTIAVIVTIFIVIMYPGTVPPVLLGLELCMAGCSFLFLLILIFGCHAKIEANHPIVFAGDEWEIPITINNKCWLPIPYIEIRLQVQNRMSTQKTIQTVVLKLPARGESRTTLIMKSQFCGVIDVQIQSYRIYEPFCLFGWTKRDKKKYQQMVFPKLIEMEVTLTDQNRYFIGDAEEYDSRRPGDDPSEILRFREYMPGDRMSQINWKMSVRKETILVKERSLPLNCVVELLLDTRYENLDQADAMLTVLCSVSWALLQQNRKHRISWYEEEQIVSYVVAKEEELLEIIKIVMTVPAQKREWKLEAWAENRIDAIIYEQILFSNSITVEEADFIFCQKNSRKQALFLVQQEKADNQLLKAHYEENCYEILAEKVEEELSSIWLQI